MTRFDEMREIADFARTLEVDVVMARISALCRTIAGRRRTSTRSLSPASFASIAAATARRCILKPAKSAPTRCCNSCATSIATICSSTSTRPT